ncbi:MAG: alanine racemase [Firmicutes bacterium]|nr:alanine racemase [Bacillota bacterium]
MSALFDSHRCAWIEIDVAALQENYRKIQAQAGVPVMAVVKADAYGHGAVPVALALAEAGATHFAVATADELRELRNAGICGPILVLGFVSKYEYPSLLYNEGLSAIYSLEQAQALSQAAACSACLANVHIKIDSGMSRIGFPPDAQSVEDILAISQLPSIRIGGIFSHLACADDPENPYNQRQLQVFRDMVSRCREKGLEFPLTHIANSAAALALPEARLDMVRAGLALYGCYPHSALDQGQGLQPVMSVYARITRIFSVPAGTGVSYGCTWTAPRDSVLATLPLGYADGVPRLLSNRGHVLIAGQRAPIVGRVCMDQFMVDVTDIVAKQPLSPGDKVVFLGRQGEDCISAEEIAAHAETVHYELLCHLGSRLPRNYINSGDLFSIFPV